MLRAWDWVFPNPHEQVKHTKIPGFLPDTLLMGRPWSARKDHRTAFALLVKRTYDREK